MALDWTKIEEFYQSHDTHHAKALLQIIPKIKEKLQIEELYYFNSHDTLCITQFETAKWRTFPFITIKATDADRIIVDRVLFKQKADIAIKETKSVSVPLEKSANICIEMIQELQKERA